MNGGVGRSWFKLLLVDEEKQYVQLEGRLQTNQELAANLEETVQLVGVFQEHQVVGNLRELHLVGRLKEQYLIGTIGGEEDE